MQYLQNSWVLRAPLFVFIFNINCKLVLLTSVRFSPVRVPSRSNQCSISSTYIRAASTLIKDDDEVARSFIFGNSSTSFASLGVHAMLVTALNACGMQSATVIQAKTFQRICDGPDLVIAAETGSGKTLSYLVPILQKLLEVREGELSQPAEELPAGDDYVHPIETEDAGGDVRKATGNTYPSVVVLVPNKELGAQVVKMCRPITSELRSQGVDLGIEYILSTPGEQWPYYSRRIDSDRKSERASPDILVCTPAVLSRFIRYGSEELNRELFTSVRRIVFDEADMLLDGSYLADTVRILDSLKFTRRFLIKEGKLQVHESHCQYILAAATVSTYGLLSIENIILKRFPKVERISNEFLHKLHPLIQQEFHRVSNDEIEVWQGARLAAIADAISSVHDVIAGPEATGWKNAGLAVEKIAGEEDSVPAVSQIAPTMVFVNTADSARLLADRLNAVYGLGCVEFHSLVLSQVKKANFKAFQKGEARVLICTDSAARGLDLPHVRHVIQAEFAENVVQYLHRIGRASRAGRRGRATNFFSASSDDLLRSILTPTPIASALQEVEATCDRGLVMGLRKLGSVGSDMSGESFVETGIPASASAPDILDEFYSTSAILATTTTTGAAEGVTVNTQQQQQEGERVSAQRVDSGALSSATFQADSQGTIQGALGGAAVEGLLHGVEQAFSRRRGFRTKIKKEARRQRQQFEGGGDYSEDEGPEKNDE